MHINDLAFLATISRRIMYRTAKYLTNQKAESYQHVLDTVVRIYNQAGFKITTIHCDNEYQLIKKNMANLYGIRMNYSNPQEHVPEAERSIRVKRRDLERRTTVYHSKRCQK